MIGTREHVFYASKMKRKGRERERKREDDDDVVIETPMCITKFNIKKENTGCNMKCFKVYIR